VIEVLPTGVFVWDAWPGLGVSKRPLKDFLALSPDPALWGRVEPNHLADAEKALHFIKNRKGLPYDSVYTWGDQSYYCSELLAEAYGLEPIPMTFGASESAERKTWDLYFQEKNISTPESQPGMSPLGTYLLLKQREFISVISLR
jgi:hypothetical protein